MSYKNLPDFEGEPAMALFDLGFRDQNPIRYVPGQFGEDCDERFQYRHYEAVALAPEEIKIPGKPYTAELAEAPTVTRFLGTTIGVDYNGDMWDDLPPYMYSSGHIAKFSPVSLAELFSRLGEVEVIDEPVATDLALNLPDIFHFEQPLTPTILVGEETIISFLDKYVQITESDKRKKMASRQIDYLMPRVDWDLVSLMVTASLGGVDPEKLPIPEEHRYRVLLNTGDTIADGYMWDRRQTDSYKEEFIDKDNQDSLEAWICNPHYLAGKMLQPTHSESLGYLVRAYGISIDELAEVIEETWFAHNYWAEKASEMPLNELYKHFHRDPDPVWARDFLSGASPSQIEYYRKIIVEIARMSARASYFKNDSPYTAR